MISLAGLGLLSTGLETTAGPLPEPTASALPRWRGFNLLNKFMVHANTQFAESDFQIIADWGMNFVRLPMDYRCWADPADWTRLQEPVLKEIDKALEYGRKHSVHVNMNFHRAPGYTVASPAEARDLWTDEEAQRVCALHWSEFARRYRGVPNRNLSFNLFNEPAIVEAKLHKQVVSRITSAIHEQDPARLVICDGRFWGNTPPSELVGLGVAASTRGYQPMPITHYHASWVQGSDKWALPTYPLKEDGQTWDRDLLLQRLIKPWKELQARGVGVMVGEFGAHNQTPHPVVLSWMEDCLSLWKDAGWGWALWNLRGSFGVLDSDRADVSYTAHPGGKLDRQMLALLQKH